MNRKEFLTIAIIAVLLAAIGAAAVLSNPKETTNSIPEETPPPTTSPDVTASPSPSPSPSAAPAATATPTQSSSSTTPTSTPTPSPTPIPSPSPYPTPDPASVVFSDGFQSGNLSAWTSTDQSGVYLGVKNSWLECYANTVTNGSWGYVYKWFNQTYNSLNWRWYLFFDNLPTTDGNIVGAGGMYNSAIEGNFTPANGVCALNVVRQNGVCYWNFAYVHNNTVMSVNSTSTVSSDTWYLVELKAVRGAGDGEVHFYLNNVEALNATGLINTNNAGIDHVSVGGGITADQPVTWYCASAIASTEHIGPTPSVAGNLVSTGGLGILALVVLFFGVTTAPAVASKLRRLAVNRKENRFST